MHACRASSVKIARICPIYKGGKSTQISNYRPISIFHVISRIFEKVVYKQLSNYLYKKQILCDEQFGFRKKRTTTNAIGELLTYVYRELDDNNYVFSLFVDFRKAFDCVNHDILLSKMKYYGIREVCYDWFKSYLRDRSQYVMLNNFSSSVNTINTGVPQGSILGPLLFLIFINDIVNCSRKFKFVLYADDSNALYSFNKCDIFSVCPILNLELNHLTNRILANDVIGKC